MSSYLKFIFSYFKKTKKLQALLDYKFIEYCKTRFKVIATINEILLINNFIFVNLFLILNVHYFFYENVRLKLNSST